MPDLTDDELHELHSQLVVGDPTAAARLASALIRILPGKLRGLASRIQDAHIVDSATGLSVAKYLANPERFQPGGRTLANYLVMDISGDVKNELEKRSKELPTEVTEAAELVEVKHESRNRGVEEEVLDAVDPLDVAPDLIGEARRQLDQLSPRDRALALLVADGVRSYAVWSEELGISHLPVDQQRLEVKRQKDRIVKRLERMRPDGD